MEDMEKTIEMGIACIMPIYQSQVGNSTKIITECGNIYVDQRTMRSVLKIICKYYTIHLEACREKYGKVLQHRLGIPIPIHHNLLLIPLKMRKPLLPKDGAYGYVNLYSIADIKTKEENTILYLHNGMEITCLQRIKTVQQNINNAKLLAKNKESVYHIDNGGEEAFCEFYEAYQSPATKGDIAFLKKEIVELKRVLKKGILTQIIDKNL
ncbi:MAG: hypothetical protein ACOYVK_17675 [Bacillota bacterium]